MSDVYELTNSAREKVQVMRVLLDKMVNGSLVVNYDSKLFDQVQASMERQKKERLGELKFEPRKYISLTNFPDLFYRELQNQINRAYSASILPAVQILIRNWKS